MNEYLATLNAKHLKIAIIVGKFNQFICKSLLDGAVECFVQHQGESENIDVFWVPGAYEMPLATKKAAESGKYHAVICLGVVIRGATPHFDYVAGTAASGISSVSLETGIPIIFGVLTTETIEQAIERAGTKAGNKGWDATLAAIEMVQVIKKIEAK